MEFDNISLKLMKDQIKIDLDNDEDTFNERGYNLS